MSGNAWKIDQNKSWRSNVIKAHKKTGFWVCVAHKRQVQHLISGSFEGSVRCSAFTLLYLQTSVKLMPNHDTWLEEKASVTCSVLGERKAIHSCVNTSAKGHLTREFCAHWRLTTDFGIHPCLVSLTWVFCYLLTVLLFLQLPSTPEVFHFHWRTLSSIKYSEIITKNVTSITVIFSKLIDIWLRSHSELLHSQRCLTLFVLMVIPGDARTSESHNVSHSL